MNDRLSDFTYEIDDFLLIEDRYEIERQIMTAVKKGDTEQALYFNDKMKSQIFAPRTEDTLRNAKNFTIVFNTLLRKAIEEVNVHPFYINEISRNYAIKIEQCTSLVQIRNMSETMLKDYCGLVKNHSVNKFSSSVQKCIKHIDFHYNENISLIDMAEMVELNASYLSSLFTKEVGISLVSYLNQTRIKHAQKLLVSTNKSMEEIANECGYEDSNYFSRMFKKFSNVTPSQYRKKYAEL